MPTYQYECETCGHGFEKFQGMTESVVKKCPSCGGRVKRLIGPGAGFILKKSGPHQGDSGSSSPGTHCGRDVPCCGRDAPCDSAPCND